MRSIRKARLATCCGDFESASENFEKASAKNPSELLKAAEARLMAGDLQGADGLFLKHLGPGRRCRTAPVIRWLNGNL